MSQHKRILSANEIGNYVVCPQSWFLKYVNTADWKHDEQSSAGVDLKQQWTDAQGLASKFRYYCKVLYLLLLSLVIVVFLIDLARHTDDILNKPKFLESLQQSAANEAIPNEIIILILTLGVLIFVWDLIDRRRKSMLRDTGLTSTSETIALRNSEELPVRNYQSNTLGLQSTPDALQKEKGFIIPVDRKPLANKIRDRHVIQLLVHMRLIEEIEGKKPPYGILLMGKKVRPVRVKNTDEKQLWLDSIIAEMQAILDKVPPIPTPSPSKCKHCDVRQHCEHSAWNENNLTNGHP